MSRLTENKIVLVVRETRLDGLKARFNTVSQTRFYVEKLGGDFADYEEEDRVYHDAIEAAQQQLAALGRLQVVRRAFVPNFLFGPQDVVIALGQDGLVANTLKYLDGQPLVGVNPDPARYDGQLLPFQIADLAKIVPEVFRRARPTRSVTMATASLNNGQMLHAVNDLFIGPKSHGSARYTIRHAGQAERHSSSGVVVSTGMGSTGWFSSLMAGARGISSALDATGAVTARAGKPIAPEGTLRRAPAFRFPWSADHLYFTVREPFPSKTTGVDVVFGRVSAESPLAIESHMPERGVIFSDGVEADFLEFNSGLRAEIRVAERKGVLVT